MSAAAFALAGLLAGLFHAGLLWRVAAGRGGASSFALRLGVVGAALLGASGMGELVSTTAGWAVGFAAGAALVLRRATP